MGKLFDFKLVFEYMPFILSRFHITILIVLTSAIIGTLMGLIIAVIRIYKLPVLNLISKIYISFIRGTPVIIQLFIIYYALPILLELVGINVKRLDKIYFILVAYTFNNSAFMSEIIRSAIISVPLGQTEAAYSIGLSRWQTLNRIILPQAFKISIPAIQTRFIGLFESTSLAFTLGVMDMMGQAEAIGSRTYHVLEGYTVVAIVFILVNLVLEKGFSIIQRKMTT